MNYMYVDLTLYVQIYFTSDLILFTQDGSLCISRGHRLEFSNKIVFLFLKIVFVLANSADQVEMHFIWIFMVSLPKYSQKSL